MNTNLDDLKHIRSMMERSSKFLSISGMAGVAAGTFALIGAGLAYLVLYNNLVITSNIFLDLVLIALFILAGASASGLIFSMRKAKKNGEKFWMPTTIHILKDFGVPMITGGIFCLLLIYHNTTFLIPSAMLIFYGIALINAASRTFSDVKILGGCEIFLGILAGVYTQYNLFIWSLGFGVLHIAYGILIYFKYDNAENKNS